jgi:four helix bundle protein
MRRALARRMAPARHYSDLIVWQLAEQIRIDVFKLTSKPGFATDFKAKEQAEDSINSTCRNIAEGFGCETHGEFARFLEFSRRSLNELHDVMHGARLKKYVTASDVEPIRQLSRRLYPAFSRFITYLKRTPDYRPNRGAPPRKARERPSKNQGRTEEHQARTDKREEDRTDKRENGRADKGEPKSHAVRSGNCTDKR